MSPDKRQDLNAGKAGVGSILAGIRRWLGLRPTRPTLHGPAGKDEEIQPVDHKDPLLVQMVKTGVELQEAGRSLEAIRLFDRAIELSGDAVETAHMLNATADNYYRLGEYAQAQTRGLAALEKARACGSAQEEGSTHWILGETAVKLGELDAAAEHFKAGADHFSQAGNEKAAREAIGRLVQILGDHPDEESAAFYRSLASEPQRGSHGPGPPRASAKN